MRTSLSTLLLALSPCLMSTTAFAEDTAPSVVAIDDQLFTKHTELKEARKALDEQETTVSRLTTELEKTNSISAELSDKFAAAKKQLDSDYKRMIDDPSVDIASTQAVYQGAWNALKTSQSDKLSAAQSLEEGQLELSKRKAAVTAIEQTIAEFDEVKIRARVARLNDELEPAKQINVSFTNRCQANMTLSQCDGQTKELALQKAVKQFQSELLAQTTESEVVVANASKTPLNIHVLRHSTSQSGFYDGERYRAIMDVELEARPNDTAACHLLGVDKQYCFAPGYTSGDQFDNEKEIAWVTLSLRSNQYNDSVFVDGVAYGSTPVEIMLPVGQHNIQIHKDGYNSFDQNLTIKSDHNLKAVLKQKANPLRAGDRFADLLKSGNKAPQVVTVLPGRYLIGEHASDQVTLDHAFGMGATPITVSQFEQFVAQTDYQTDAELKNTCTAIVAGEVTAVEKSYWRNPGFKQSPHAPVVCISQNDAQAYVKWLSKQTGAHYRLPSEDEWEVAARAGSQTNYWWGDNFVASNANTGWSSSPWSNVSTSPVTAFKANPLGIYDTVGNVWQWTDSSQGITKGGAWNFSPSKAVAHERLYLSSSSAANYVGFRVVRDIN
ncbi:SUMF1/EgtB/PvdO family nonheme iron enzyme [Vibrio sp. LaRot3]|uniref:SUMF1/EgtB/PvdO family nonheme iron enzyme n=1 Tax=Vibrio sp. LaRot3 TaxID=2998829 RepID=UPI0022CE178B|nr:SUMF1/EgtB/PvdO family nonheme iron enzyme [Vibrio sp. LaRot3]MDA0149049.1 SUMF1/EgtB/PvdO family nonheme iron enzyme [Vibrio sp. LaRot3]